MTRRRVLEPAVILLLALTAYVLHLGCEGIEIPEPDKNKEPDTELTGAPVESTTAFYRVHLFWKGFDSDGVIEGFEYAVDDTLRQELWTFTNRTDSVFVFNTATEDLQLQRRYHRFFVRAIDNQGKEDPAPAVIDFFAETDAQPRSILLAETANRIAPAGSTVYAAGGLNGLDVFDIGDPQDIRRKSTVFTGGSASDLVLDGDYLYLADGPAGVTVLDVSDPNRAAFAARYATLGLAASALAFQDPYLFVADGANGILVLDMSVPEDPVFFARYRAPQGLSFVGVAVLDDLVFGTAGEGGIVVLRFRPDREDLILLPLPETSPLPYYTEHRALSCLPEDGVLYVADADGGVLVLDVAADGSLTEIARRTLVGEARQIVRKDQYLLVASGSGGVGVLDVSDPANPVVHAHAGYSGFVTGLALSGEDTLVVCNGDRGISLVDVSDPSAMGGIATASATLCPQSPAETETLLAFSSVKFCWSGVSPGGEVVAYRYQLQGINNSALVVPPESTTVFYQNLPPKDQYIFSVETKDETGLWSSGDLTAERRFTVNFDPESYLDSIWVTGPYTDAGPIPLTASDTLLPDSTFVNFSWHHTDKDTVQGDSIVGSWWRVGGDFFSADTLERVLVSRDMAGPLLSSTSSYVLEVGGIDSYGRREKNGATFRFQVNYPPDIQIISPEVNQTVNTRDSVTVVFRGIDRDGPPLDLIYEYMFRTADNNPLSDDDISGLYGTPEGLVQLRLPTFGYRGRVFLEIMPIDRLGRGKQGIKRTVQFFLNY